MSSKSNARSLSPDHRQKLQEKQDNHQHYLRITWLWGITGVFLVFIVVLVGFVIYLMYLDPAFSKEVGLELFKYIIGGVIGFFVKSKI